MVASTLGQDWQGFPAKLIMLTLDWSLLRPRLTLLVESADMDARLHGPNRIQRLDAARPAVHIPVDHPRWLSPSRAQRGL